MDLSHLLRLKARQRAPGHFRETATQLALIHQQLVLRGSEKLVGGDEGGS